MINEQALKSQAPIGYEVDGSYVCKRHAGIVIAEHWPIYYTGRVCIVCEELAKELAKERQAKAV